LQDAVKDTRHQTPPKANPADIRLASLAMYASPRPVAEATAALFAFLRDHLKAEGVVGVPDALSPIAYDAAWVRPDLLLAQTCGYPYVSRLRGSVRLVATPCYSHPGCDGPDMCSFLIVADQDPARTLVDLKGARAAINQPDSNSGANLLRATIAPFSREGRFFRAFTVTGSHAASIDAVRTGAADIAAIDCITFAHIKRFDPARLAGIRVMGETMKGPGLPLITSAQTSDADLAALRRALHAAAADASLADVRDVLGLTHVVSLGDADYQRLADLEIQAKALGYLTAGA
jgi:ABC-type phosphate/phosphonate transport system substrate-binding protein